MPFFLFSPPPRHDEPELIDETGHDYELFKASFHDIRIVNRYFGGTTAVLKSLWKVAKRVPPGETLNVLDIGTGSADIPLALAGQSRKLGRAVRITALDNHPDVLRVAREATAGEPAIEVAEGDIFALPYDDNAFHVAMCSLTFHHLGVDGCVRAMREMDRVSSAGWVANDGERRWLTLFLIRTFTPIVTRNPLTRHDAVTSVRRGFTRDEMLNMAVQAGYPDARVIRRPVCRIVVERDKALNA